MVDADHYKVFVHNRFRIPVYVQEADEQGKLIPITDFETAELSRGAISLFIPRSGDHLEYIRQILAERQRTEFVPERGPVTKIVVVSQVNHFLDATYAACAAAVDCGIHTTPPIKKPPQIQHVSQTNHPLGGQLAMPDGRHFDY